MENIQKLKRLENIIQNLDVVLNNIDKIEKQIIFNSKINSLNKLIMSLKQYQNIIELDKTRIQKKIEKL